MLLKIKSNKNVNKKNLLDKVKVLATENRLDILFLIFFVAMFLLAMLLLLGAAALAEDFIIPDPEHFFGESMEETRPNNYVMHFSQDPWDMYEAYMALLLSDYNTYDLEITPTAYMFGKVGADAYGMTIEYFADEEGTYYGCIVASDVIRPDAHCAIEALKNMHYLF